MPPMSARSPFHTRSSRAFKSKVVFYDVSMDASFCRNRWGSDHFAVTAEIGLVGKSTSEKARGHMRIDPSVLHDPAVREMVRACIVDTRKGHDPACGHSPTDVWELIKFRLNDLLLNATKVMTKRRKETMSKENRIRKLMQRIAMRNDIPSADRARLKTAN